MSGATRERDVFLSEILGQPEALRRAGQAVVAQGAALAAVAERAATVPGPVVLTGMGSSYDTCYAAATALAAQGTLAVVVDAAELLHFRQAAVGPDSLLVAVSQSGESAEVVRLAAELRARSDPPFLVSVTNGLANSLARAADVAFDTAAGPEAGPSTMTFAGSLVLLAALARVLGEARKLRHASRAERATATATTTAEVRAAAQVAADRAASLLGGPETTAARLEAWLAGRPTLAILGRGAARPAAEMAALTLKEAVGLPVESMQTAEFRHGPLELVGPELAVVLVDLERSTSSLDAALARELVAGGAVVLVVSPEGTAPPGAEGIAVGELERVIASAVALIPLQLLAWRLAVAAGRQPGEYTRATKVTRHE